MTKRT
jgi:hypothetical protein